MSSSSRNVLVVLAVVLAGCSGIQSRVDEQRPTSTTSAPPSEDQAKVLALVVTQLTSNLGVPPFDQSVLGRTLGQAQPDGNVSFESANLPTLTEAEQAVIANAVAPAQVRWTNDVYPAMSEHIRNLPAAHNDAVVSRSRPSFEITRIERHQRRSPGSISWMGAFNTFYWIDPTTRMLGIFATQVEPTMDPETVNAFGRFERAAYSTFG